MAKSIRVSDGIYELAMAAGGAVNRSLADQVEYWARLGAMLDAAGITMEQSLRVLGGDADLKAKVIEHTAKAHKAARSAYTGAPSIAARNAQFEQDVTSGRRSPESLFMLSREQVRSAKFSERATESPGEGW